MRLDDGRTLIIGGAIATRASGNTGDQGWIDGIPQERLGSVEEVASAAAHLAGDDSAYMTGQQLVLDGGVPVRGPFA